MATILESGIVCDGFDVTCVLSNGARHTFHFVNQPEDIQTAVDNLEAAHLAWLEQAEQAAEQEV